MQQSKKILIFSTSAGFCHRMTCDAIIKIFYDTNVEIEVVEFYDFLDHLNIPFNSEKTSLPEMYNKLIQEKGNTGFAWILSCLLGMIFLRINNNSIKDRLTKLLLDKKPDLVISVIPMVNKMISRGILNYKDLKLHTVVVDFCQPLPRIWIQSKNQIIYGWNERLMSQAKKFGIPKKNLIDLGGQLLSPQLKMNDRKNNDEVFKVFVIFGGNGSRRILKYANFLEKTVSRIQINYISGNNLQTFNCLNNLLQKNNSVVHKFIANINEIYNNADIIIGKPGPAVISEALFMKIPLLLELNSKTLFQERYNAKWAEQQGISYNFKTGKEMLFKLETLVNDTSKYSKLKQRTYSFENKAPTIFKNSILKYLT